MWGWEEKAACSYAHTENSVHLFSPGGGAGSSAVSSASTPGQTGPLRTSEGHHRRTPEADRPSTVPCMSTIACSGPQLPALPILLPFWRPQGHSALSGNHSSGQLSLAFLSSESCIFLPIFGGGLVIGQLAREYAGGSIACSPALLPGVLSSCPSELERAPGRPSALDAGLPGKGGEALLFLSAPERRIRSQMFL